jgi:hypothetical protein
MARLIGTTTAAAMRYKTTGIGSMIDATTMKWTVLLLGEITVDATGTYLHHPRETIMITRSGDEASFFRIIVIITTKDTVIQETSATGSTIIATPGRSSTAYVTSTKSWITGTGITTTRTLIALTTMMASQLS